MNCIQCEKFPFCKNFDENNYCDKFKKAKFRKTILTSGQCNGKIIIKEVK